MTPEEEVARGREAQTVLNNSIYRESLLLLRGQLMDQFQSTKFDQSAERDEIWRRMQTIDWFERQLSSVMQTGQLGEQSLEMRKH